MNRRGFLTFAAAVGALAITPQAIGGSASRIMVPQDASRFWEAPRQLWLGRSATGEQINAVYWENGAINPEGYLQICRILRDVQAGQMVHMSIRLLDILRAIQGWLAYYKVNEPIIINSGYRTRLTNQKTEGAALASKHITGQAGDITIPTISAKYLSELSASFQGGGVGFYPFKNFVHVDDGPIRKWKGR